jgi:16S rRNA (cytosine967-C5)-methyltransferase
MPTGASTGAQSAMRTRTRAGAAPAPARRCAFLVLRRVFERGAYADLAFRAEARALDARDRALAMRLAYGAVQRKGTLDHLIGALAERSPERLDAPVRATLRLGLYELLYLHSAPDRAIVADAVELAKGGARAARGGPGLVNAVLRRAAREGGGMLAALDDSTPERAAIAHSHPEWIARMWWQALGTADARALMASDNEPAELAVRVNTLRTDRDALRAALALATHTDPRLPEALVLDAPFDLQHSAAWRDGLCLAQSRAAMLVAHALSPQVGERVLDLCAAPGGKSTHIAALMRGQGEVVAVERNRRRAEGLARTARRLGAANVRVVVGDARSLGTSLAPALLRAAAARPFDRVLVDPPCSGLGTLQGNPDLRWRMTPRRLELMAAEQAAILERAGDALRPGGVLVYSTCTISPTENERLLDAFLHARHDFDVEELGAKWPELRAPGAGAGRARAKAARRFVVTLPHRDRTAGFFVARLRRS